MPKTAIQVRVSAEQRDEIRARAERVGLSLSDYIRHRALGEVEVEAVEPPVGKVSPPPSTATPSPAASPEPPPPAADDDLEGKVAARARQLYGRGLTRRQAAIQARRELTAT